MVLRSERIDLLNMTPGFLEVCLAGNAAAAGQTLGVPPPPEWMREADLMRLRLGQMKEDPSLQPWLLYAVVLRAEDRMIGHVGFHTAPGPGYLQIIAPDGVELGYTVYPDFRRRGYARDACECLMEWARREHGVRRFVVSISPENAPSLALARNLGFVKVGEHWDEEDGLEDVFLLDLGEA